MSCANAFAQRILSSVSGSSTLLRSFTLLRLALLLGLTALYRHFSNATLRWLTVTNSPMHRSMTGSNQVLSHFSERFLMMLSRISILDEETLTAVSKAFETSLSLTQPSSRYIKTPLMSTQQPVTTKLS